MFLVSSTVARKAPFIFITRLFNTSQVIKKLAAPHFLMLSFTAKTVEDNAVLNWSTSWETNSNYFGIEHSPDGKSWQRIGAVSASGESHSVKTYQFIHTNKLSGINYYRLRIVDLNLTDWYSRIQQVNANNNDENAAMYPNPVSDKLLLNPNLISNVKES